MRYFCGIIRGMDSERVARRLNWRFLAFIAVLLTPLGTGLVFAVCRSLDAFRSTQGLRIWVEALGTAIISISAFASWVALLLWLLKSSHKDRR